VKSARIIVFAHFILTEDVLGHRRRYYHRYTRVRHQWID